MSADRDGLRLSSSILPTRRVFLGAAARIPINVGDTPYTPLFEHGFGLGW